MGKLKSLFRKKLQKNKVTSESILENLRKGGAEIGEDVRIFAPDNTVIDATAPFLLTIGNHVRITEGVIILTHDYSWSVLKRLEAEDVVPGRILGAQSPVEIGNNVFIGMNTIITRGVKIGDNVIIGAGSVVTKDCDSDSVYAGNPAKKLMTVKAFYEKREARQFEEAREIAIRYRQRFGTMPPKEIFFEYFMLFAEAQEAQDIPKFKFQLERMDNEEASLRYMQRQESMFPDYDAFLKACYK